VYDLTAALLKRGYNEANIQAVLGGNFRRLLGNTWLEPKRTPPPKDKNPEEKKQ
jgi:membrane dipeptidase